MSYLSNSSGGGGGGGTVTTVSVVSANGFAGSVATPGTTPAITLSTTQTGILFGNGTAIAGIPDGLAGQQLTTNGAGVYTWQNPTAGTEWQLTGNNIVGTEILGTTNAFDLNIVSNGSVGGPAGAGGINIGDAVTTAGVHDIVIGSNTGTAQQQITIGSDNFGTSSTIVRVGAGSSGNGNTVSIGGYTGAGSEDIHLGDFNTGIGSQTITMGGSFSSTGGQTIQIGELNTDTQFIQIGNNSTSPTQQRIELGLSFAGTGNQIIQIGDSFTGTNQTITIGDASGATSQDIFIGTGSAVQTNIDIGSLTGTGSTEVFGDVLRFYSGADVEAWPIVAATAGQVLTADGAGQMSWQTNSATGLSLSVNNDFSTQTFGNTGYTGIGGGGGISGTETNHITVTNAGTVEKMKINVVSNTLDNATTFMFRINNAASLLSIVVPAGGTGVFTAATSVALAEDDLINIEIENTASTTGAITWTSVYTTYSLT